ncbi:MAG: carbon-nitrogen hydrolase [Patescibacteria group bacterium]
MVSKKTSKIIIGLVQTSVSDDSVANVAKTITLIEQAASKGAAIIALQELFQTPYFPQWQKKNKDDFAEPLSGATIAAMRKTAKRLHVAIIVPFYEEKDGKYFNTAVVINKKGSIIGHYHKIHIPHDPGFYEKDYFEHGELGYKTFSIDGVKFSVLICYDQWFPEAARMSRLAGAQVIFYPTAIGHIVDYKAEGDWHNAWETIQRSHGIANSVYIAAINRIGREGNMEFYGQSFIAGPFGEILKKASSDKDEVIVATLDLSRNAFYEEGWGFLRNRRPDTYSDLTHQKLTKKSKKLQNVDHYASMKKALGKKKK